MYILYIHLFFLFGIVLRIELKKILKKISRNSNMMSPLDIG